MLYFINLQFVLCKNWVDSRMINKAAWSSSPTAFRKSQIWTCDVSLLSIWCAVFTRHLVESDLARAVVWTYGLTWMMVPSVSTLSSLPSGNKFFTVWSGNVISLWPSGKCFSEAEMRENNQYFSDRVREHYLVENILLVSPVWLLGKCRTSMPSG